jgi:competence protein ComFC
MRGMTLKSVALAALNLLYPRRCAGCSAPVAVRAGSMLCAKCEGALIRATGPRCAVCGEVFEDRGEGGAPCSNCGDREYAFTFAVAEFRARGLGRDLIHRFKYQRQYHLCQPLGWMLGEALGDSRIDGEDWVLVPVPLHWKRRRERQYNQAEEICRVAGRARGWMVVNALWRRRDTIHQARLDREQRLDNLEGAFGLRRSRSLRSRIEGARVLLVDDVFTTGATTNECARILAAEGGAREIVVATAMRG